MTAVVIGNRGIELSRDTKKFCRWSACVAFSSDETFAEAPLSAAEWAVALRFVELLQAQPGRHVGYYDYLDRCASI